MMHTGFSTAGYDYERECSLAYSTSGSGQYLQYLKDHAADGSGNMACLMMGQLCCLWQDSTVNSIKTLPPLAAPPAAINSGTMPPLAVEQCC